MEQLWGDIFRTLADAGGYAVLLGVVVIMAYSLIRTALNNIQQRAEAREESMHDLLEAQLHQEKLNAERCREMSAKTVDVLNKVAGVMGETNAILGQAIIAFNRNTEAFDKNTEAFKDFVKEVDEWKSRN